MGLFAKTSEQLQRASGKDPVLQSLKTTVLTGWPALKDQVPVTVLDYWNYRDEIGVQNGVLFKGRSV